MRADQYGSRVLRGFSSTVRIARDLVRLWQTQPSVDAQRSFTSVAPVEPSRRRRLTSDVTAELAVLVDVAGLDR